MKPPIPGAATPPTAERRLMTVWPSIGAWPAGRLVGRLVGSQAGFGFFTLGKLWAVAMIPLSLGLYAWRLMPFLARRYTLSSGRVRIERGLRPAVAEAIALDAFDAIEIAVLPGQEWLRAGDLIFRHQGREVFRLPGVCHPEGFRQTCWNTRTALLGVRQVLQEQAVASG
jgi:hypothetical protein